jgi:hypothetical protein
MALRLAVAVAALCVLAHTALAQSRGTTQMPAGQTRPSTQPPARPSTQPPVRPIPPPQPPIPNITGGVAQLPPMGGIAQFPQPADRTDLFRAGRRTYSSRQNRYGNRLQDPFGYVGGGGYGYYGPDAGTPGDSRREEAPSEFGYLRLGVSPGAAQVYIDGFYVSTVDGFAGAGPSRAIEAGPHRVEIRADGYETATFDVRITPNETTSYNRELERREEPSRQARNVAPAVPKTFYVIPKCYAGDKPPAKDALPKGCQALNVRTVPPVLANGRRVP